MSLTNSPSWMYNPSTGFYSDVATQSLRFDQSSSSYISDTLGTPTNRRKFTMSMWIKRSRTGYAHAALFGINSGTSLVCRFRDSDVLQAVDYSGSYQVELMTTRKFRDTSSWYHLVFIMDIDNNTGVDRFKLYVNNERTTWTGPAGVQNYDPRFNFAALHYIGRHQSNYFDGYIADVNFVDGQALLPTSFAEEKNDIWIPKTYSGSYGNNGFYLKFAGNANDSSGNGLNFTTFNISAHDYVADCPENNWCTLNSTEGTFDVTYSEGGLKTQSSATYRTIVGTTFVSSGKWYFEHYNHGELGIVRAGNPNDTISSTRGYNAAERFGGHGGSYAYNWYDGNKFNNNSFQSYGATFADGDITACALDLDAGTVTFYKNNVSQGVAFSGLPEGKYAFGIGHSNSTEIVNFGQDSTFAGNKTTGSANATDANGFGDFYYTPPSGHLAMCSANLPEPTISPNEDTQAGDYFNTVLYTGNGTGQSITGVGFQPDWTWIKRRSNAENHWLTDSVRGVTKGLLSNSTSNEATRTDQIQSFDADGFTLGNDGAGYSNINGNTYVAWNWKANGGTTSSNTSGSITSTVQANQTAGFSILTYTGNSTNNATIGHGLSQAPDLIITKHRTGGSPNGPYIWPVFHHRNTVYTAATGGYFRLQDVNGTTNNTNTVKAVGSSTYTVGTDGHINQTSGQYVAYVFHEVEGYSSFGGYRGNGNTNGTFVATGFRPAFVIIKAYSNNDWLMYDTKRIGYNENNEYLLPNRNYAEQTDIEIDIVSNGFKIRDTSGRANTNNTGYIYIAFAEQPFKYANAR